VVIACAIGIAVVAVGVATYLMAVDSDTAAWVFYVLAGVITLGMPAIPWFYLRQLRALLEKPAA
jgi:DhnA family fructose-bisphosphate aldolase class Ia